MRFDDRLTTVLAGESPVGGAAVAQYRQLVDIMGQIGGSDLDVNHAPALARIHALRGAVSEADRLVSVQCLSGRLVSPVLVQYLAAETPAIAGAAIRAARLDDATWAALVPALPSRARGFLRNRRDLGVRTRALLDRLGIFDTALPDAAPVADLAVADTEPLAVEAPLPQPIPETEVPDPEPLEPEMEAEPVAAALPHPANDASGPQSIGEIVKRIEALQEVRFKQAQEERGPSPADNWNRLGAIDAPADAIQATAARQPDEAPDAGHFQFATGMDGAIASVSGVALGSVFGLSLAVPASPGCRGVDASVATAFSRRMPVRGGRADLGSAARFNGEWRIDADPCFDRATGRFTGYSGIVRRPLPWESAGSQADMDGMAGRDGMRQIVHELRTPLNAIMGFSEIIEQQLFGPVTSEYRDMALRIGQDARQLLAGFDDLDTALRLDRDAIDDPAGHVPLRQIIDRLFSRVQPLLDQTGARLDIGEVPRGVQVAMSQEALDRILPRLVGALVGMCQPGENLAIALRLSGTMLEAAFDRPASLSGLDEAALLDVDRPVTGASGGGPLLGFGFCLRLVHNLLARHGGQLSILPDALRLTLPMVEISEDIASLTGE